jgi:hypothetical protein
MDNALLQAHQSNLRRYCQLLWTDLTEPERQSLHRRIAETHLAIDRLELGAAIFAGSRPRKPV